MARIQIPFSFDYPAVVSGATVLEPVIGTAVSVINRDTGNPATVYQTETTSATYTSLVTDAGGNVPGWVDPGSYRVTAAAQGAFGGASINFEAVRGDAVSNIASNAIGTSQIQDSSVTLSKLVAAVQQALIPTATILDYAGSVAPAGFHLCDGSVQSQTDPVFVPLFNQIGTNYNIGGEGAGQFRLPDAIGRTLLGAGTAASGTVFSRTQRGGEETHVLSVSEMPVHAHSVYDPAHAHGVSDPGHGHSGAAGSVDPISSTSMVPVINDASILSWQAAGSSSSGGWVPRAAFAGWGGTHLAHSHPVLVAATTTGIGIYGAYTGIALYNSGAGLSHNNLQPYLVVSKIIKL